MNHKIKVQQWKNTAEVIEWFTKIEGKKSLRFFIFDIVAYYPSISPELLNKAFEFARAEVFINEFDMKVIKQARKTFLFHKGEPWVKKGNVNGFDIAMGAFDGAECCELVGLYLLNKITKCNLFSKDTCGLYCDDGLAVLKAGISKAHKVKLKLEEIFRTEGLQITV